MLQNLAEYFQSIHKTCKNDGSLQRTISSRKFAQKQSARCAANWKSNARANCAILPANIEATGYTLDATKATIVVIIMANMSMP